MTRGHVAFQRTTSVQRDAHNDQQAGTAKLDRDTRDVAQNDGQHRDDGQKQRTDQGDLVQRLDNEVAGGLAGTDARNGAVILAQLVRDVDRVVLDRNVEVVERNDKQQIHHNVHPAGVVEGVEENVPEGAFLQGEESADQAGDAAQR